MDDKEFMQSPVPKEQAKSTLTKWKNEPTLVDLKRDLDAARPSHDTQMSKIKYWNDLLYVKGKAKPIKIKGRSAIQPKLIRRQAEWRYSALTEPFLGSQKLFKIEPVTFEDVAAAKQNEQVLNYQFRHKFNRVKFIDDMVRSTVDDGVCIVQVGWNRVTKTRKIERPVYEFYPIEDEQQMQTLQQVAELKQTDPRAFDETVPDEWKESLAYTEQSGQPVIAKPTDEVEVDEEEYFEQNNPTAVIHHPENVIIDPSCNGDMSKALFVVVSFETNKAELYKQQDRYKNLDKVTWDASADPNHVSNTPTDYNFADKARKKTIAYEYWGFCDIHGDNTLVPIVATWIGDTLIRMEESPFPDKELPFVLVPYLPVKRELYGEPDAELLEDQQKLSGAVMRGIVDLLGRSANSQIGIAKGLLDPVNKTRFDRGEDYEYNPGTNPASQIIEHRFPEIPNSAVNMLMLQNQEAESLTGVKSFSGGISGEAYGQVAAGIRGVLDASSKREMAILRRLAQGVREIGRKFVSMNAVFLSDVETIRITNTEFVEVKREDLEGNFDLIVDISTAEIDNAKAQDLSFMYQTIGPSLDSSVTVNLLLAEIAELKRMPELAQKLRSFKQEPNEMQQQAMQLDMELKQLEIERAKAEIAKLQAQAQELTAQANLANQDYQDQASGIAHARAMEKQKAQAEGNQDLQVTKALAQARKPDTVGPNISAAIGYNEVTKQKNKPAIPPQPVPIQNVRAMDYSPTQDPRINPNFQI